MPQEAQVQEVQEVQEIQEAQEVGQADGGQAVVQEEDAQRRRHIQPDNPQGNRLSRQAPERRGFEWARWIRSQNQATTTYQGI